MRVVAVDWSGRKQGERRSIWLAEAVDGELVRLEDGRTRDEVADHVVDLAAADPDLVVGFDFSFALPAWFFAAQELTRVDDLWAAAIRDGDWVVVRQQPVAENGEIVAAMIDGEATVKTLRRRDGHAWLMPANPAYDPIPGDEATVLGRVVAVLRRL